MLLSLSLILLSTCCFFLNAYQVPVIGLIGMVVPLMHDFPFYWLPQRDTEMELYLKIVKGTVFFKKYNCFLNNCKWYSVIMNYFLPMTLYAEAVKDLITESFHS